jgi:alpha-glucosidase
MVNLPRGKWYYFWTGQAFQSEAVITLTPDQIPFFVREGGVLPVWPIQQWTGQRDQTELTLYVYYKNGRELSEVYEDAGDGYGYQEEQFCLTTWETEGSSKGFSVIQTAAGKMTSRFTTAKIYMIGLPFFAKNCSIDGKETPIKEIRLRDRSLYTITVPIDFHQVDWTE